MTIIQTIAQSLSESFFMFWEVLWALVLGFALSGAVQAFVSRGEMQRILGSHSPRVVTRAGLLGIVSSSCSYAASALAKSLFTRGADFTTSMVFMFASTNLVVELGIILWLLMGWQFALAEFVGGIIMIVLLTLILPRVISPSSIEDARKQASSVGRDSFVTEDELSSRKPMSERVRSLAGWSDAAAYTVGDLSMVKKELIAGFLLAGAASVMVPVVVWQSLFITGHGFWSSLENVLVGPLLAIISFVCSVGNVPLAAALWKGGISFGGVISFVFADLITLPLLLIYRKYYGGRLTLRLLAVFWGVMSVAGLATEYLFRFLGIVPTRRPASIASTGFQWDYTTFLNVVALMAFAGIYYLYWQRERLGAGVGYAHDPVCGMQVETRHAPARSKLGSKWMYFCSDRCRDRFVKAPHRFGVGGNQSVEAEVTSSRVKDPVCGMRIEANGAPSAVVAGIAYSFCCDGCRDVFLADPDAYTAGSDDVESDLLEVGSARIHGK
jgi:uncharacterized protein